MECLLSPGAAYGAAAKHFVWAHSRWSINSSWRSEWKVKGHWIACWMSQRATCTINVLEREGAGSWVFLVVVAPRWDSTVSDGWDLERNPVDIPWWKGARQVLVTSHRIWMEVEKKVSLSWKGKAYGRWKTSALQMRFCETHICLENMLLHLSLHRKCLPYRATRICFLFFF